MRGCVVGVLQQSASAPGRFCVSQTLDAQLPQKTKCALGSFFGSLLGSLVVELRVSQE